jgi:RimJ/RimL family protein N-acetyltransferase
MLATRFLAINEFELYGDWLREQSTETLSMYFGIPVNSTFINSLVDGILSNPDEHYFLVAMHGPIWVGVIHLARISETQMEFGIMVSEEHRHKGIADVLISEAITWIQNRGFNTLYLHCLNRNSVMKHLAQKHGLVLHENGGDIEAKTQVPPPSLLSYFAESVTAQKNIFFLNLRTTWGSFSEQLG